jgi:hypothetical protein
MKVLEILSEMRDRRDSWTRDYDSSQTGFSRGPDHRGLEQELAHETNNYAVSINGKTWKVFGSRQEANRVSNAMERKYPDKKIGVHETGAPISENATAGATSAANVGTVVNPHHSPGKARGKKSYLGSPWGGQSGTKAPPQPKVVQPKNADGTAKNGLEMGNIFGSGAKQKR